MPESAAFREMYEIKQAFNRPRGYNGGPSLRERLFSNLVIDKSSGCLLWVRSMDREGYGKIRVAGRYRPVHRVMYVVFVGMIPDGLELDHVRSRGCRHRRCASPAHLEPVTGRENKLRGDTIPAAHAAATHCINGHEFNDENVYWCPDGRRNCRTCRREAARRHAERKRRRAA